MSIKPILKKMKVTRTIASPVRKKKENPGRAGPARVNRLS